MGKVSQSITLFLISILSSILHSHTDDGLHKKHTECWSKLHHGSNQSVETRKLFKWYENDTGLTNPKEYDVKMEATHIWMAATFTNQLHIYCKGVGDEIK